jgi:hypothetical protein
MNAGAMHRRITTATPLLSVFGATFKRLNPRDKVFDLVHVFGFDSFVILGVPILKLHLLAAGHVVNQFFFGFRIATEFGRNVAVSRAIFLLLHSVAFEAFAVLQQAVCRARVGSQ